MRGFSCPQPSREARYTNRPSVGLASGDFRFFVFAREVGVWLFLVPVVYTVAHRMIPFFSASVLRDYQMVRPNWSLVLIVICVIGHAALEMLGLLVWRFVFDVPLLLTTAYHTWVWQFWRSFEAQAEDLAIGTDALSRGPSRLARNQGPHEVALNPIEADNRDRSLTCRPSRVSFR
ncbi:MAG: NnrS family protein [Acidiferrobacterales bacterium]